MRPQVIKSNGGFKTYQEEMIYNPNEDAYGYYNGFKRFIVVLSYGFYRINKDKFEIIK
jgi:hypothetical protein